MGSFKSFLDEARQILSNLTGAAVREAEAALSNLEHEAANVHKVVGDLVAQAKVDAEAAVAAAEPEVKAAVSDLVAKLEADIQAALAQLVTHAA